MANEFKHTSILLAESVKWLITDKSGIYVDCTMGGAGHSFGFASQLDENGMLIGIDQDEDAIAASQKRLAPCKCKIATVKSNFKDFGNVLDSLNIELLIWVFQAISWIRRNVVFRTCTTGRWICAWIKAQS